jgi:hypothetical protein
MIRTQLADLLPLLGLLFALPVSAEAQNRVLQEQLATAASLDCRFTTQALGDWNDNETSVEAIPVELDVSFSNVNADEGTADAGSDFGPAFIVVRYTNDYLHLVQMFSAGPLYTTTVLAVESEDNRLQAVHTRHEFTAFSLPGFTSRPEMYIGDCSVN